MYVYLITLKAQMHVGGIRKLFYVFASVLGDNQLAKACGLSSRKDE